MTSELARARRIHASKDSPVQGFYCVVTVELSVTALGFCKLVEPTDTRLNWETEKYTV